MTAQQIAAKKAELQNRRQGGTSQGTTQSGFKNYVKQASSQRIVGADKQGNPIVKKINASKINHGNSLSEELVQKVELQKRRMFEESLAKGEISIFVK